MKGKNTKIILSVLILALMVVGFVGFTSFFKGEEGEKTITISIFNEVENNEIMESTEFNKKSITLGDFLEENRSHLKEIMSDSKNLRFL